MKKILLPLFLIITSFVFAQTKHTVTVENFSFTPADITINQGDTVLWNNINGFHSVDGSLSTYPSNPEGFSNANAGAPWTFTHVFNIAGNYDYRCGVHTGSMFGTITVNSSTSIAEVVLSNSTSYPNPTNSILNLPKQTTYDKVEIYDVNGKIVFSKANFNETIDVSGFEKGTYLLNLSEDSKVSTQKIIIQ
ncbi:MAG: T9SS type A sorting domain-containing protein [Flavobacteriales bacterium]|nr:T9SS type A sorting domain-containing protein [Flavobacteriales bacterium]MCB9335486.1 T9SS type A sorting domain-containing protein [Flavobacteriales bacterium]